MGRLKPIGVGVKKIYPKDIQLFLYMEGFFYSRHSRNLERYSSINRQIKRLLVNLLEKNLKAGKFRTISNSARSVVWKK